MLVYCVFGKQCQCWFTVFLVNSVNVGLLCFLVSSVNVGLLCF